MLIITQILVAIGLDRLTYIIERAVIRQINKKRKIKKWQRFVLDCIFYMPAVFFIINQEFSITLLIAFIMIKLIQEILKELRKEKLRKENLQKLKEKDV